MRVEGLGFRLSGVEYLNRLAHVPQHPLVFCALRQALMFRVYRNTSLIRGVIVYDGCGTSEGFGAQGPLESLMLRISES